AVAEALAPFSGELDGTLVGLRAAVAEEDVPEARGARHQRGQLRHALVVVGGAAVDQTRGLGGERLHHRRVAVAETVDGPALHEVEILTALAVAQPGAASLHHDDGWPG